MSTSAFWVVVILHCISAYVAGRHLRQGLLLVVVLSLLFGLFSRGWYRANVLELGTLAGPGVLAALVAGHVLVALAGVLGYAVRKRLART